MVGAAKAAADGDVEALQLAAVRDGDEAEVLA